MKRVFCFLLTLAVLPAPFLLGGCQKDEEPRSKYTIDAEYADGVLEAVLDLSYYNDTDTEMQKLSFNLYGNAYREGSAFSPVSSAFSAAAYYDGKSYGGMEIASVSPCASYAIEGQDENVLSVTLQESVSPGKRTDLRIEYSLKLADIEHRTGVARHAVNLGNFYPVLCVADEEGNFYECEYYSNGDPFYSECADYSVTLTADSDYTVAASGKTVSAQVTQTSKTQEFSLKNARDFALVLGTEFSVLESDGSGTAISYYYYDDENAAETLTLIENAVAFFGKTFGAYPYETFAAVQTGFCYGGMEYPGLVMLSDALSEKDYMYTAVHETAHQWWYAAVGNNQLEEGWLDEGLAEYSTACFFDAYPQYSLTRAQLVDGARSAYKAFCSVEAQLFGGADTTMDRKLCDYKEYEYVNIAYNKGMLLFDTLRDAVGDSKFFAGLRRYYSSNAGKISCEEDLIAAFGNAGAEGVIRSFIEGEAII